MTRERMDGWCEHGMVALVLAVLISGPLMFGAVRGQEFAILQWLAAGAAGLAVVRLWLNPNHPVLWTPVHWAVLAFMAFAGLRYFMADVEYAARGEVLRLLTYAVLFLVMTGCLGRQRWEKAVAFTLLAVATGEAVYALYQFLAQSQQVWHYARPAMYGTRGTGTYFNPNHLAGFLEMVAPLGLALAVVGRLGVLGRILCGYAAVMALAGVGVSLSRGGWLATGLALTMFCGLLIAHRIHRAGAITLLAALVLAAGVFLLQSRSSQQRITAMFEDGRVQDVRFLLWGPTIDMWRDHPWLGVGPGHYDVRFRQYRPVSVQLRPDRAHNDYLNALADWGIIGTAMGVLPLALMVIGLSRRWKAIAQSQGTLGEVRSNRLALALGGLAGLAAILVHAVVDFNFHIPANAITVVALMALLSGLVRHAPEPQLRWPAKGPRAALSLALALAGGILVWQGARRWTEETLLDRASQLEELPAQYMETLERAFDAEPRNPQTAWKLGEAWRLQSWAGGKNYKEQAERALGWHRRAVDLNPYDPYSRMSIGMCLDWLDRPAEAEPWFKEAHRLDPNNYYVLAHVGWHYVQAGDYTAAVPWLERSLKINSWDNQFAATYLDIAQRRLREAAGKTAQ
jgi:O-antigen ligase